MIPFYIGTKRRPVKDIERNIQLLRERGYEEEAMEAEARLQSRRKGDALYSKGLRLTSEERKARQNACARRYKKNNASKIAAYRDKVEEDNFFRAFQLLGSKCSDCKQVLPPAAMEFHHEDPSTKKFHLGGTRMACNWESIEEEVKKCVLICANCHRIRHTKAAWKKRLPNGK